MKIPHEDVVKLEFISRGLENVKDKSNPILQDMVWLTNKLREAWLKLEKEENFR